MDDAFVAYRQGHADGRAGRPDAARGADPETGADYKVGVSDGRLAAFEDALIDAIRKAMGDKLDG
jgi:hypothetical protein